MFNDIIKKPVLKPDSYDEEFSKEYEKWMEEYGKLIKKDFEKLADIQPIEIYTSLTKPVEFIVLNFVITKTGACFTDV